MLGHGAGRTLRDLGPSQLNGHVQTADPLQQGYGIGQATGPGQGVRLLQIGGRRRQRWRLTPSNGSLSSPSWGSKPKWAKPAFISGDRGAVTFSTPPRGWSSSMLWA